MNDNITVGNLYPKRIIPSTPSLPVKEAQRQQTAGSSFQDILQQKLLKFSHHAEMRLQQRGIHLEADQLNKIQSAVQEAASKGAKDSLILMNNMALIVNVKNNTVVTAMDQSMMKNHVFTQIDSAVIIS
ncbi:MAG: flagellar biosynthesis protein [Paenibacillus sp. RIFOXYA1_FULL_44_5]|nr:MAG: flagellar biosynthesis protein [Paenibacillus sp. RIFOXYA1_FULL_44_5]